MDRDLFFNIEKINKLFDELLTSFYKQMRENSYSQSFNFPKNMVETENHVLITFRINNIIKNSLKIWMCEDEVKVEAKTKKDNRINLFKKNVKLPIKVEYKKADAVLINDLLRIEVPKKNILKKYWKRISIKEV